MVIDMSNINNTRCTGTIVASENYWITGTISAIVTVTGNIAELSTDTSVDTTDTEQE